MSRLPGKGIIRNKLKTLPVSALADSLDVDATHIYNVKRRGVSPTLHDAMVDAGWLQARGKRHRSHIEHGRGQAGAAHKERTLARIEALGYGSVTEFVEVALDRMEVE